MELDLNQGIEKRRGERKRFDWRGPAGMKFSLVFKDVEHNLFPGSEDLTAENFFPDGAVVIALSAIVTVAVTTTGAPTHLRLGDGTVNYLDLVVTSNAIAKGTSVTGLTDPAGASPVTIPKHYSATTNLVITKVAGTTPTVTAGKVRIVAVYFTSDAPKG